MKMNTHRIWFVVLACLFSVVVLLSGCDSNDGPAESTGKKVEGALEKTGKKVEVVLEKTGQEVEGTLEKTGKKVEGTLKETGDKVDESVNRVKGMFQSSEK